MTTLRNGRGYEFEVEDCGIVSNLRIPMYQDVLFDAGMIYDKFYKDMFLRIFGKFAKGEDRIFPTIEEAGRHSEESVRTAELRKYYRRAELRKYRRIFNNRMCWKDQYVRDLFVKAILDSIEKEGYSNSKFSGFSRIAKNGSSFKNMLLDWYLKTIKQILNKWKENFCQSISPSLLYFGNGNLETMVSNNTFIPGEEGFLKVVNNESFIPEAIKIADRVWASVKNVHKEPEWATFVAEMSEALVTRENSNDVAKSIIGYFDAFIVEKYFSTRAVPFASDGSSCFRVHDFNSVCGRIVDNNDGFYTVMVSPDENLRRFGYDNTRFLLYVFEQDGEKIFRIFNFYNIGKFFNYSDILRIFGKTMSDAKVGGVSRTSMYIFDKPILYLNDLSNAGKSGGYLEFKMTDEEISVLGKIIPEMGTIDCPMCGNKNVSIENGIVADKDGNTHYVSCGCGVEEERYYRCDDCGERVHEDEMRCFGDHSYCESCYDDNVSMCSCCGEDYWSNDGSSVQNVSNSTTLYFCEDCVSNYTSECGCCGELFVTNEEGALSVKRNVGIPRDEIIMTQWIEKEEEYVCDRCLEEEYSSCCCCSETFKTNNLKAINDKCYSFLCDDCYEENYVGCDLCNFVSNRMDVNKVSNKDGRKFFVCSDCDGSFSFCVHCGDIIDARETECDECKEDIERQTEMFYIKVSDNQYVVREFSVNI